MHEGHTQALANAPSNVGPVMIARIEMEKRMVPGRDHRDPAEVIRMVISYFQVRQSYYHHGITFPERFFHTAIESVQ